MKNLQKGENILLSQAGITSTNIFSGISWINKSEQYTDVDISAFLLNDSGKVNSDSDFIFYNQPQDSNNSILLDSNPNNGNDVSLFSIKPDKIPPYVSKIVFTVSIYSTDENINFSSIGDICIRVFEPDAFNERTITFKCNQASNKEKLIVLGEMYLYKGQWKFKALGNAFDFGLAKLASSYGVDLTDDAPQTSEKQAASNLVNDDSITDKLMAENEIRINKQIKKHLSKIKNAVKEQLNESNTRIILDRIFMDVFGYKMEEIHAEVKIQGRRADYVLSVGDKDVIVVEVKKAGMNLKEDQIFQATSYGAYSGIQYVILTNLSEFILFKIKMQGIVEYDGIFEVDLLSDFSIDDIKHLALVSRYGMTKPELLESFCTEVIATSPANITGILMSDEIAEAIKAIIKRDQNCLVTNEQIQETIQLFLDCATGSIR
ncbi:MAG: hypothetical protein RIQ94_2599 [Pseudomonadota bacterium]|jgi:stress response protein SCP2/predicted type IV restriction endonuclease